MNISDRVRCNNRRNWINCRRNYSNQ